MDRVQARLAAVGIGVAFGLLIAGAVWVGWDRKPSDEIVVVGDRGEQDALLAQRAAEVASAGDHPPAERVAGSDDPLDDVALVREPLTEQVASTIFQQIVVGKSGVEYDPDCYFKFRPNQRRWFDSDVRDDGGYTFQTNGIGLREADEVATVKPELRVLVAGDSQTEGYNCAVQESYPNRLEAILSSDGSGRTVEVLNAGMSGYSLYHYVGVLERFLPYEPDVYIMSVYGGNDFKESLLLYHYFNHSIRPRCEQCDLMAYIRDNKDVAPSTFHQSFHQLAYFRHHPEEREAALHVAFGVTAEVQKICAERGIRLICVYLPPMPDVQPQLFRPDVQGATRACGLKPEELDGNQQLADEWLKFARGRGVECVDARVVLRGANEKLYWDRNHHLNLAGNRRVAQAVSALFR